MSHTSHIIRDGIVSALPFGIASGNGKPLNLPTNPDCKVVAGMTVQNVADSCSAAREARVRRFKNS